MSIYDLTGPLRELVEAELGFAAIRERGTQPTNDELHNFKEMRDQATLKLEAELDKYIDERIEARLTRWMQAVARELPPDTDKPADGS